MYRVKGKYVGKIKIDIDINDVNIPDEEKLKEKIKEINKDFSKRLESLIKEEMMDDGNVKINGGFRELKYEEV